MQIKTNKYLKIILAVSTSVIVFALTLFGVMGYTSRLSEQVTNEISVEKLNASLEEEIEDNSKTSIVVNADSDNTEHVYVRVALVAYWTSHDNANEIYTDAIPDMNEYINTDDWIATEVPVKLPDGTETGYTNTYYVYKKALAPGETTNNLLKEPIQMLFDNNKRLEVTVLMQASDKETFERSVMS